MSDKRDRIDKVNQMIRAIGDRGRRFFYSKSKDRYASVEVDHRGRVWWIDDYTGRRIYTHYRYRWQGFSHGGTLQDLVGHFRDFIAKGKPVPARCFGPWPSYYCDGDLWGYGEDMEAVRVAAKELGIIEAKPPQAN